MQVIVPEGHPIIAQVPRGFQWSACARSTKLQAPSSKHQAPEKHQAPSTKLQRSTKLQAPSSREAPNLKLQSGDDLGAFGILRQPYSRVRDEDQMLVALDILVGSDLRAATGSDPRPSASGN